MATTLLSIVKKGLYRLFTGWEGPIYISDYGLHGHGKLHFFIYFIYHCICIACIYIYLFGRGDFSLWTIRGTSLVRPCFSLEQSDGWIVGMGHNW